MTENAIWEKKKKGGGAVMNFKAKLQEGRNVIKTKICDQTSNHNFDEITYDLAIQRH